MGDKAHSLGTCVLQSQGSVGCSPWEGVEQRECGWQGRWDGTAWMRVDPSPEGEGRETSREQSDRRFNQSCCGLRMFCIP